MPICLLVLLDPEDKGTTIFQNVRNYSQDNTASHPRRQQRFCENFKSHKSELTVENYMQAIFMLVTSTNSDNFFTYGEQIYFVNI